VRSEKPAAGNKYNQNFRNKFCGCQDLYDPHQEKGTMFQCLGLGTAETGGCGEDWWHPECLLGVPRPATTNAAVKDENKTEETKDVAHEATGDDTAAAPDEQPLPAGFPAEDDFETFICYKCLEANPWLKRYAGTPGFLPPVFYRPMAGASELPTGPTDGAKSEQEMNGSKKRKADDDTTEDERDAKRSKDDTSGSAQSQNGTCAPPAQKHDSLPAEAPTGVFSLFLKEDFRDHLCRCATCFPNLVPHPQLRDEEEVYEPPLSEDGDAANGASSHHSGSLLERGEAALSNVDRVRAIEGVMVYNHLKDKVKEFLKPFAETGEAVSAEAIKAYFEKLRGDDQQGSQNQASSSSAGGGKDGDGDNRKEQSGEFRSFLYFWLDVR
jgi:E3 ubiquitin-protein ligase UBR7